MYKFFLVVHAIIAAALVGVILMQRSEGGGLAGGGSPAGLMSARGAADFLTRTTTILASLFVTLSIGLAALAIQSRAPAKLDTSLVKPVTAPAVPVSSVPMAGSGPVTPVVASDVTAVSPKPVPVTPVVAAHAARERKLAESPAPKKETPRPTAQQPKPKVEKVTPPPIAAPTPTPAPAAPAGNSAQ